jgi:hypothetical protein
MQVVVVPYCVTAMKPEFVAFQFPAGFEMGLYQYFPHFGVLGE